MPSDAFSLTAGGDDCAAFFFFFFKLASYSPGFMSNVCTSQRPTVIKCTVDNCPCCMLVAGFILSSWLIFLRLGPVCSDDSVYCCRTHPSLTVRRLSKGSSLQSRPLVPLNLSLLERYSLPCPRLPIGPQCSSPFPPPSSSLVLLRLDMDL